MRASIVYVANFWVLLILVQAPLAVRAALFPSLLFSTRHFILRHFCFVAHITSRTLALLAVMLDRGSAHFVVREFVLSFVFFKIRTSPLGWPFTVACSRSRISSPRHIDAVNCAVLKILFFRVYTVRRLAMASVAHI
jgi:hypothetical protein